MNTAQTDSLKPHCHNRCFAIVSYRNYTKGGGGEMFLYQTAEWVMKRGMTAVWISFADHLLSPHPKFSLDSKKIYNDTKGKCDELYFINLPGWNSKALETWLKALRPLVVHHQGHHRREISDVTLRLNIPLITGYHFWVGAVKLSLKTMNREILKNISEYKPDDEILALEKLRMQFPDLIIPYGCSNFLREVIKKVTDITLEYIIEPASSSKLKINYKPNSPGGGDVNKWVTQINLHSQKGGELFLKLMKETSLPLLGVFSESGSEILDNKIRDFSKVRAYPTKLLEHTDNVKEVYYQTRLLLVPTLVDETFCRVVNEAMMSGIPIVTTGNGAIKDYLQQGGIILPLSTPKDYLQWVNKIKELYDDVPKLLDLCSKSLEEYKKVSEDRSKNRFTSILDRVSIYRHQKVALFVPWADQGLGIQARYYKDILDRNGYQTYIFSFRSYFSEGNVAPVPSYSKGNVDPRTFQADKKEWWYIKVYYSPNFRESVTDEEITNFVVSNNIGHFIIPETCWSRVFEIAKLVKNLGVKVYAIPNLEIVRSKELIKHNIFDKIGCNNFFSYDTLKSKGLTVSYLGFSIPPKKVEIPEVGPKKRINFLNLGGVNGFTRKQCLEVCEAFSKAVAKGDKLGLELHLTVSIQKNIDPRIRKYKDHPNITLIEKHLSYQEITNLYEKSDIVIQVSKHEGLGLGFYEALAHCKPLITLDTSPHNELVSGTKYPNELISGYLSDTKQVSGYEPKLRSGWLVKCKKIPLTDNDDAIIQSAVFEVDDLADAILGASEEYSKKPNEWYVRVSKNYHTQLNYSEFEMRFLHFISS